MIVLNNINKIYNEGKPNQVNALKNLSMTIGQGELVAITGPSGSGKSTLLHIIAGLDVPSSGTYFFKNMDMATASDKNRSKIRNKDIGIVLQDFGLLGEETVLFNVSLPLIIGKRNYKESQKRAKKALSKLGILDLSNKPVNQLSGGQQQRVAIARALVTNSSLILADEPTGALDSENTQALIDLFKELNQQGITIIIVTHNPKVAQECHTIYSITDGILQKCT